VNKTRSPITANKATLAKQLDRDQGSALALPQSGWTRFWFAPVDPIGLHAIRVLAGLLFLFWLLPLAGCLGPLFSTEGWLDLRAYSDLGSILSPATGQRPINWSLLYLFGNAPTALAVFYGLSLIVLVLFTLGVCPRLTAVLTWLIVGSFVANPATAEEAEQLLPVLALYLMVGYVLLGQGAPGRPMRWRLLGPLWPLGQEEAFWRQPSAAANGALRLLQVHFAIVMLWSGLHKVQMGEWWSGRALWWPLHPAFETHLSDIRALAPSAGVYFFFLSLAAYAGLTWQLAFPVFAWRRGWGRVVLLGGAALGFVSLAFLYELPLFGPALVICCLAYLTPAEWHWLTAPLSRLPGLVRPKQAPVGGPVRQGAAAGASALATPR
jgi:hypothetical protein